METAISIDLNPVARDLHLPPEKVERTVGLLDEGNTVPFITRYRKDQTGGLDEEQIRRIQESVTKLRLLTERKAAILKSIELQGKLTPELADQINAAPTSKRLEDLYLPFKPKKQTLATLARQRGLEPLAQEIHEGQLTTESLAVRATEFVRVDKDLPTLDDVMEGVRHLLAERFSERADLRSKLRRILWKTGKLVSKAVSPPDAPKAKRPAAAAQPVDENPAEASPSEVDSRGEVPATGTPSSQPPDAPVEGEPEAAVASVESAATPAGDGSNPQSTEAPLEDGRAAIESPGNEAPANPPVPLDAAAQTATASDSKVPPEVAAQSDSVAPADSHSATDPPAEAAAAASQPPAETVPAVAKVKKKKKKPKKEDNPFADYYDYQESLSRVRPHRLLAINRGERAKILRVKIEADQAAIEAEAYRLLVPDDHPHSEFLRTCVRDALARLVLPVLEREARRELTEKAEQHAVTVFARNLRKLLLQPPVRSRRVMALDPGFRSGCKFTALDEFGNLLGHGIMHIVGNAERRAQSRQEFVDAIRQHRINAIAIGNGTACRQTETLIAEIIGNELKDVDIGYVIVNEAGASVYSTSTLGRDELPDHDAVVRGAVSIGRRLLDPLSELVKINPANIGVGMYQHDMKAKHLQDSLDAVVESSVNFVGVDVNTASPALLRYVSGLNQLTARRLYEHRKEHGPFKSREQFKQVAGFGEATFVQAAGFLKIDGGENPLDATSIHPESYDTAKTVLEKVGGSVDELVPKRVAAPSHNGATALPSTEIPDSAAEAPPTTATPEAPPTAATLEMPPTTATSESPPATAAAETPTAATSPPLKQRIANVNVQQFAAEMQVGELSLKDILAAIAQPGRDPREDLPPPVFRRGIIKFEDLEGGMELTGTVLNVVDFGAFVDIGLKETGLIHISRLADRFVEDPHQVVGVGDVLKVWVVEIDKQRRRVSLTAIKPGSETPRPPKQERPARPQRPSTPRSSNEKGGRPPRRSDRHHKPKPSYPPRKPPKPKPVKPITKEMEEGKEPMRSFSDLMQFFDKKKPDDPPDQSKKK